MTEKLTKTSTSRYLSDYLEDLQRAGVQDVYRGGSSSVSKSADGEKAVETLADATDDKADVGADASRPANAAEEGNAERLKLVAEEVARCSLCSELVANRTQTVFGSGNPNADLAFVGEGPGADEDAQGVPFVGRSGKLLTDMIEKGMGIPRSSVFICNVVRCRPPQNRNPSSDEARACRPFLDATLEIVRPRFICCLGSIAATNLLGVETSIGKLRGKIHEYRGAQVVCTYHPAYLLRNPSAKKQTWEDLQLLMKTMGLAIPGK